MKKIIALVAIAAFVLTATPAFAGYGGHSGSDIEVENDNHAFVTNVVGVTANTGYNGLYAGSATGGNANAGSVNGSIVTGDAYAVGKVYNTVNSNDTSVKTPCRGCEGDIEVENDNGAFLSNDLGVLADTGANDAVAGNATATGSNCFWHCTSGTANGGNVNGSVVTGNAYSSGKVVNVVNTNLTRINRGSSYYPHQ